MEQEKNSLSENIIIGRNTVREAIRKERSIDAVFVQKGIADGSLREIIGQAKRRGIIIKEVPKSRLDEISMPFGYADRPGNHQGIAAQVASIVYSDIEDVIALAKERGEAPFLIALDGITDPQNLGAIVRSAEVLGAHGVLIPRRRNASMTAAACKTACGAEEYIPIVKVGNLCATLQELKERGIWIAAADMDGQTAQNANLTGALCLVIGAEGEGVSRLVKKECDFTIKIEMKGRVQSLNASAAAAILMYEKLRQDKLVAER